MIDDIEATPGTSDPRYGCRARNDDETPLAGAGSAARDYNGDRQDSHVLEGAHL